MKIFASMLMGLFLALPLTAHAERATSTPVESSQRVVTLISEGNFDEAKTALKAFWNADKQADEIFSTLSNAIPSYGKNLGNDLIENKKLGNTVIKLAYLLPYDERLCLIVFGFIKKDSQWKLVHLQMKSGDAVYDYIFD